MKLEFILNWIKCLIALIIGGFLGATLLAPGLLNGNIIYLLSFGMACTVIGFILAKI